MRFIIKHIYLLFVSVAALLFFSCTDEILMESSNTLPGEDEKGETIALTLSLQSLTRASEPKSECEKYEDYIDPSKIILLFFYAEPDNDAEIHGKYDTLIRQYGPSDLTMIPIETTVTGDLHNWYVKLPILEENDGFADILRKYDFKVAALVNWQSDKLADLRDAVIENGEIAVPGSHISLLHHLSSDDVYTDPAYSFLMEGTAKMGLTESWVNNNFSNKVGESKPNALTWIKTNWKPDNVDTPMEYIPDESSPENVYKNLRYVWNFNAAYQRGKKSSAYNASADIEGLYANEWADKNYFDFYYKWLTKGDYENQLENLEKAEDTSQFEFVGTDKEEGSYARLGFQNNKAGVILPSGGSYNENAFRFNLLTSGTILVEWEPVSGTSAKVKIQGRNHYNDEQPTKDYTLNCDPTTGVTENYPLDQEGKKAEIKVTGDSEYISIYAEGGEVIIYGIEYIQDQYLYETDRDGVAVSQSNPIAMYGIQKYTKLGSYWKKGMLFNLSDFNNLSLLESQYPGYQKISLIRSVAKIELRLPKSFDAHNVYLRSSNRRARFEPLDVSLPTNNVWGDYLAGRNDPLKFEFDNICNAMTGNAIHPFYDKNSQPTTYEERLAWYYGNWADNLGGLFGVRVPVTEGYPYPRILNPRIDRSDFVRFIKIGDAEGIYTKYVLYVPEKFIDDPNKKGELGESPKLCHIEFRRGEGLIGEGLDADPSINVDDDNCYRIYFTKNGFYSNGGQNTYPTFQKEIKGYDDDNNPIYGDYITWENSYEKNVDNLRHHWPIIRNHIYSFVVEDANQKVLVLKLEVLPWKEAPDNSYSW